MIKDARLLLFHADRLDEDGGIDHLVERLTAWGAVHVQVRSSVSRRQSPAYTVLVEIQASEEWRFGRDLAVEFGIARYHRLAAEHIYQPVNSGERPLIVKWGEDGHLGWTVHFNLIGTEQQPLYVRVEESDVTALAEHLAEQMGQPVDPLVLRRRLEALLMREEGFVLEWEV